MGSRNSAKLERKVVKTFGSWKIFCQNKSCFFFCSRVDKKYLIRGHSCLAELQVDVLYAMMNDEVGYTINVGYTEEGGSQDIGQDLPVDIVQRLAREAFHIRISSSLFLFEYTFSRIRHISAFLLRYKTQVTPVFMRYDVSTFCRT